LSSEDKTIQFWDGHADSYAQAPIKDAAAYNVTLERTRQYLAGCDHVLELGAGTGSTALELASSSVNITATDISPAMIEIAKDKAQKAGIRNVDFRSSSAMVPDPFFGLL